MSRQEAIKEAGRRLRAELEARFGRLSQRERVMVSTAGAAVVVFVVLMISAGISRSTTERQRRIEEKTRVLAQVAELADGYRRAQAERQALEARLKAPPVPVMTHVSQTGQALGMQTLDQNLQDLVKRNLISIPEARSKAANKDAFVGG